MTRYKNALTPAGHGKLRTWLSSVLLHHRVWLGVNLASMTIVSVIDAVGGYIELAPEVWTVKPGL